MLLFSSALVKHELTFTRLSDRKEYIKLAATWAEEEWGYIRNKGVEYRSNVMNSLSHDVYTGTYAGQPVGMFALIKREHSNSYELMYVCVDKKYRGLGFGKQLIEEAKRLAAKFDFDIVLETLRPGLNAFYARYGATVVCESKLFSHTTDVLKI